MHNILIVITIHLKKCEKVIIIDEVKFKIELGLKNVFKKFICSD